MKAFIGLIIAFTAIYGVLLVTGVENVVSALIAGAVVTGGIVIKVFIGG